MTDFGWIIGLVIYAIGRSSMALGANMQRLSLRREQAKEECDRLPKKKQKLLVGGIALYTFSGVFLSIALIFASPTLLAPCGTIIFVANAFFAHFMNDEKFSLRSDGPPIALIVAGTIAVVVSAPKESNDFTNDELIELCKQPSFIAFLVFLATFIVAMFLTTRYFINSKLLQRSHGFHAESGGAVEDSSEDDVEVNPKPEPNVEFKRSSEVEEDRFSENQDETDAKFPPNFSPRILLWYMSFGMLAGGLGGLNITFTKSIFSLIKGQIENEGIVGALASPFLYAVGILLAGTFVTQMMCTTNGLDKTPAMIFVPTQSVTEETIAVLGGLFYFQDFVKFTPVTGLIFTLGEACTIFATILLTRSQIKRNGESIMSEGTFDSSIHTKKSSSSIGGTSHEESEDSSSDNSLNVVLEMENNATTAVTAGGATSGVSESAER